MFITIIVFPVFDSVLKKKVLHPALTADYRTFKYFTDARYAFPLVALCMNGSPTSAVLRLALELKDDTFRLSL